MASLQCHPSALQQHVAGSRPCASSPTDAHTQTDRWGESAAGRYAGPQRCAATGERQDCDSSSSSLMGILCRSVWLIGISAALAATACCCRTCIICVTCQTYARSLNHACGYDIPRQHMHGLVLVWACNHFAVIASHTNVTPCMCGLGYGSHMCCSMPKETLRPRPGSTNTRSHDMLISSADHQGAGGPLKHP